MRKLLAGAVIALTLAGCAHVTEPPPLTDAELDAYVQQQQALQWSYFATPGWEQPEVESRLVSWSDFSNTNSSCMDREQQRLASTDLNALSERELSEFDEDFQEAQFRCQTAVILYPDEIDYYTTAQLGFIYDYYRDVLIPCLQLQGLDVGVAPTREEFAGVPGFLPWDLYSGLGADLPPSRAYEIIQRCPPLPRAAFLEPR